VVKESTNMGIMLEYLGMDSREVHYDFDNGFAPDYPEGSEIIEPETDFFKRLILATPSFAKMKSEFEVRLKADEKAKDEKLKNLGVTA